MDRCARVALMGSPLLNTWVGRWLRGVGRDGKVIEMVHYPNLDDALAAARG
jgi:hypothetical protein